MKFFMICTHSELDDVLIWSINWGTQLRRQNGQVNGSHLVFTDTSDIDYLRSIKNPTNSLETETMIMTT